MKKTSLLIGCLFLVMAWPGLAKAARKTRVALVPMASTGKGASKVAWKTSRAMAKKLRRTRNLRVVVFAPRRAARLHQCLQVPHCIQALGQKLRVKFLVTGHVTRVGRRAFHVDVRVVRSDGEVLTSSSYRTSGGGVAGARVAARLVSKARRVRLAAASTSATDALPNAPLFSRSEAVSAAATIEARDGENPLTPGEPAPEESDAKKVAVAPTESVPMAPTPDITAEKETSFASSLFSWRYTHAWATFAAGVGALGTGVAFGVISNRANQQAQDAEYQKEAFLAHDKAKKNALVANILYGAGGAAILTSALMVYLEHRKEVRERRLKHDLSIQLDVAHSGGGIAVRGSF
jgi:TolB-like protein